MSIDTHLKSPPFHADKNFAEYGFRADDLD